MLGSALRGKEVIGECVASVAVALNMLGMSRQWEDHQGQQQMWPRTHLWLPDKVHLQWMAELRGGTTQALWIPKDHELVPDAKH